MKMPDDLIEMMENCGGEDLLRYLLKEDGMINWETISLYPIVAYSPPHMDEAILIGIAYWDGVHFNILHSEYEFEDHPIFDNWVKYLMEMGINYKNEAEALLDHHRAIIVIKRDIKEANKIGWEALLSEVIYGIRPTRYEKTNKINLPSHHNEMVDVLFEAMFDIQNFNEVVQSYYQNITPPDISEDGFPEGWQSDWA